MRCWLGGLVLSVVAAGAAGCASSGAAPAPRPTVAPSPIEHTTSGAAPMDWPVPPEEAARVNPLKATGENLHRGGQLFRNYCMPCHGAQGRGDGPLAQQWSRLPKDLSHPERQARLTDGEIFWKISAGHRQGADEIMPATQYKLNAEDRWRVVLYVRSLGGH